VNTGTSATSASLISFTVIRIAGRTHATA
jgi:hypothetical protein